MRLVCISDTHALERGAFGLNEPTKLPMGDVLLCAGDISDRGDLFQVLQFCKYFEKTKFKHKLLISGNHDFNFENDHIRSKELVESFSWTYLRDEEKVIDGVKFYGSPWQPWFFDWAFNFPKGEQGRAKAERVWGAIPEDTDVLITHGPPKGILDEVIRGREKVGCPILLHRVLQVKPVLHLFGHIHESHGLYEENGITFANACICDEDYIPQQKPFVFDFDPITGNLTRANDWIYQRDFS